MFVVCLFVLAPLPWHPKCWDYSHTPPYADLFRNCFLTHLSHVLMTLQVLSHKEREHNLWVSNVIQVLVKVSLTIMVEAYPLDNADCWMSPHSLYLQTIGKRKKSEDEMHWPSGYVCCVFRDHRVLNSEEADMIHYVNK